MLDHFVTQTPMAYVVAYRRQYGDCVIVCECMTEASAQHEADRLNIEEQKREAIAAREARKYRGMGEERRAVRFFENDVFA